MTQRARVSPVLGYNHNLRHGGRVFHVQTEDSGLPHAHYITHLFVGGNIVASIKSSYVDLIGAEPDLRHDHSYFASRDHSYGHAQRIRLA